MRRLSVLLPALLAFLVGASPAHAWTWPVDGPVLQTFALGDDPYAAGQHRGIDIGAASGEPVSAPAAGFVSFAGTVPGGGKTVTIKTGDGYAVTLLHLGTIGTRTGASVAQGDVIGTIGPTGDREHAEPYVHLGIRIASEPEGYVDPLRLLPARDVVPPEPPATDAPETEAGGAAPTDEAPGEPTAGDPPLAEHEPAEPANPVADAAPAVGTSSAAAPTAGRAQATVARPLGSKSHAAPRRPERRSASDRSAAATRTPDAALAARPRRDESATPSAPRPRARPDSADPADLERAAVPVWYPLAALLAVVVAKYVNTIRRRSSVRAIPSAHDGESHARAAAIEPLSSADCARAHAPASRRVPRRGPTPHRRTSPRERIRMM